MKISVLKTVASRLMALSLVLSVFAFIGYSQAGTAGVSGTIRDNNGAVVPGATVKLLNTATGFERTTTTSNDGIYSFASVPPATYTLEVTASGFKKLVNTGLVLAVALLRLAVDALLAFVLRTVLVVVCHYAASSFAPCSQELNSGGGQAFRRRSDRMRRNEDGATNRETM